MSYIPVVGKAILMECVPGGFEYRRGKGKRVFRSAFRFSEPTVSVPSENIERYTFDVAHGRKQGILELNYRIGGSDVISLTTVYSGQAPAGYRHSNNDKNITLVETDKPERLDWNEGISFF